MPVASCGGGRLRRGVAAALFLSIVPMAVPAGATQPPVVRARRLEGDIHLDGRLDEPAWRSAGVIADLRQQEPNPGEPTPFRTRVLLLVDGKNLYIGLECYDPQPSRIAVHTLQRDGNLRGDQSVAFVLDTFGDRRRGYYFKINAAGARLDGLISGPEDFSTDWDGIWDASTRRTGDGWSAEIRVPAQTLRFPPGATSWGFNVERWIARERVMLRWTGITLDARLLDLRRAGRLEGIDGLEQGKGLSASPYGLVRRDAELFPGGDSSIDGEAGLDVTYNVTTDLTAVLTINTDFAETEVDARQVNLTRFPLFFPEKRGFLLEGSNLFSFGSGLHHDFIPFFSRRIGLFEGVQVPLLAGGKLLGKVGRCSIAALGVSMGESEYTRSTNLFAGRVTYDLTDHFNMGVIMTEGDPQGVTDNTLVGVDAKWQTSTFRGDKNLSFGVWSAGTTPSYGPGRRTGWGLKLDYPNDLWDLNFIYKEFGGALAPALGFLPRPGTRWYQGGGAFQPRPGGGLFGWVRQFYFELEGSYIEDLGGRTQSWSVFTAPFNAQTETGEHLEANVMPKFERLDEPFEVSEGVVIPAGDYDFMRYRVEAQSSRHRPWRIGGTVWFGGFYTGSLVQYEGFITYAALHGHLMLQLQSENNYGYLPEGDFIQRLWQTRLTAAFTPDIILSSFVQYDSESRNLGTNTRLRWTIRPGNDVYVVWNHNWIRPIDSGGFTTLQPESDQLVVKFRWTFRR